MKGDMLWSYSTDYGQDSPHMTSSVVKPMRAHKRSIYNHGLELSPKLTKVCVFLGSFPSYFEINIFQ